MYDIYMTSYADQQVNASQSEATIDPSTMSNDTLYEKSFLTDEPKKVEEVHADGRFKHEDEYERMKVRKGIRTHVFKNIKFC